MKAIEITPTGAIWPIPPDGDALIILNEGNKNIVVPCSGSDGLASFRMMSSKDSYAEFPYRRTTSYDFLSDLLLVTGATMTKAMLVRHDDDFMSNVYIKPGRKKTVKISSENPAVAINFALGTGGPLYVYEADWRDARDITTPLAVLCSNMTTFPLPALAKTDDLRAFSDFMDAAFPEGCGFSTRRGP